ncbi:MAG: hypothetical protein HYX92_12305 [Chloroflexi bacterium]|nr:hypothetical protein [Chloroflexota bacterium]
MTETKPMTVRIKRVGEPVLEPANVAVQNAQMEEAKLAPRLASLKGAKIGLFNNRKPFAALALGAVEQVLQRKGVAETFTGWATMSNKPAEETLASLATADAVVLAGAD